MSVESNQRGMSGLNRVGLSLVQSKDTRPEHRSWSHKVAQCAACGQQTEYAEDARCQVCGAGLSSGSTDFQYSGYEPNLISASPEVYLLKPAVLNADERRHPRIPCRNVRASIKSETNADIIVNLINISRGGVCFSSDTEFSAGAMVSIATHYIEGGQNIFQDGQIVRVQRSPSATAPGEYAIEFSLYRRRAITVPGEPSSRFAAMRKR